MFRIYAASGQLYNPDEEELGWDELVQHPVMAKVLLPRRYEDSSLGWGCDVVPKVASTQPLDQEEEPSLEEASNWLVSQGLLPEDSLPPEKIIRRYKAFSKCHFDEGVSEVLRRKFMKDMLPYENNLAAT